MRRTLDRKRIELLYCTSVEISSERAGSSFVACIVCISLLNGRPVNKYVMSFHRYCVGKYLLFVSISPLHCWYFILTYLCYVILHAGFAWNNVLTWFVISVTCLLRYTHVNINPSAWNFLSPKPEMTCGTIAIIIRVVLLSPYLRIRAVSLSYIHYNQSHRVYINRRRQYICLIWN